MRIEREPRSSGSDIVRTAFCQANSISRLTSEMHSDDPSARLLNRPALPRIGESAGWSPMLFLVRHGESTGNQQAMLQGSRIGGALSKCGHKQSAATAGYLFYTFEELQHGNVCLVASPSTRALETATPIAARLNCEIRLDNGLAELNFGDWSGTPVAQLEDDPRYQQWKADPWLNAPPAGESLIEVRARVCETVARLLTSACANHQPLVLVTHFFPLIALFEILIPQGKQVRCDNASISRFELRCSEWMPTHINEVDHLTEVPPTPVRYV
jgi:broad specificity phosphatase PhoE